MADESVLTDGDILADGQAVADDSRRFIRLHLNESPYEVPPELIDRALAAARVGLNRYPETAAARLQAAYADYTNASAGLDGAVGGGESREAVRPDQVVPANGGDEAINLTVQALRPLIRQVVVMPPTFSEYARAAGVAGRRVVEVPLTRNHHVDLAALTEAVSKGPSLIFICDPNNPTGNPLEAATVLEALTRARPDTFVAVDEAYWEFATDEPYGRGRTVVGLVARHPNLIVLRTMSKAFSLAGARLGFAIAAPDVARRLEDARMPFNINSLTAAIAEEVLRDPVHVREVTARVVAGRRRLAEGLAAIPGVAPHPSLTNFVLARTDPPADEVFEAMKARGVLIRHYPRRKDLSHHIRVAVGTPDEIDRCLRALAETMEVLR